MVSTPQINIRKDGRTIELIQQIIESWNGKLIFNSNREDLVVRARARVSSNPGGYFSWVTDLLSAGSFYPELFVGYMGGRHLGSLGCIRSSTRLVPGDMGQSLSPVEAVKATAKGEEGRMNQFERACSWVPELGLAESRVPNPGDSEGLSRFSIVDGQATLMKKKTSGIEQPIGWSGFSVNVGLSVGMFQIWSMQTMASSWWVF